MEVAQKKKRAPKTTNKQLDFLITYMENHTAFATGKLLGARGKPVHDLQWQQLTKQLNSLDGPSKGTEGWRKLWCICDRCHQPRFQTVTCIAYNQINIFIYISE
ncbi:uncharacterized protein LOC112589930 [Harpegnathos saltator]|uniref:uncharacterized protein LOC112589930 n=1 Tax=Harpegnathos saltator TaxID=610380 RepID=UPI000DBEEA46|nr:uncharacterized protein LOC112589930 [Harpegnathos saltator]